jgi:hypothetical protein
MLAMMGEMVDMKQVECHKLWMFEQQGWRPK